MSEKPKLKSLTIFFPFYNDEGTVGKQISSAYKYGTQITDDLQVIAIHGGNSKDNTFNEIKKMKDKFASLIILDKTDNWEGYAVIKYALDAATKDWIFYTDGDAQYHLEDLPLLVEKQIKTSADVVNGYKKRRGDGLLRSILGDLYAKFSTYIFELPIRDTDCDFRLIKKSLLNKIDLVSHDSSILGEMIKKLELAGAKFEEIPVSHYPREYGRSNYSAWGLFREKLVGDINLYFKIKKMAGSGNSLRIVKFSLIGILSILIQSVLFNLFIILFKISPVPSVILADQFAIVSSFCLNNHFTFHDRKHTYLRTTVSAFIKFYSIIMISTLTQALIVYAGTFIFGVTVLTSNIFFILGLAVTFFFNYSTQKRFVWITR